MSLKSSKKLTSNSAELEFFIDKARFDKACNEAYSKNVKKINVPGFRKGKAPKAIIEKMYGKGFFYDEALNSLIPEFYSEALTESKLEAVGAPKFDIVTLDDEGVILKAEFSIMPEVEIDGYKGIKADRIVKTASSEDVDAEIARVRERNAREITVEDRAAENGDIAVIDYEGFCDGVAFEGGKGENHPLTLGSGQFIPGFEDQIVGHKTGEEFDVNVTFPAEYHADKLAGKAAVFKVKLNELKTKELPALDDDFAVDVSDFNTFDEYKASVEKNINESYKSTSDRQVEEQLIDALIANLKADVPQVMYDAEIDEQMRDFEARLNNQGLTADMYMKYTGMDAATMRTQFQAGAERQVKARLALEKIAELENLTATEEDTEAEIKKIADAYGIETDVVKNTVSTDLINTDIKMRKAIMLVKDNADITELTEEEAQKKAAENAAKAEKAEKPKKASAKKTAASETKTAEKKSTAKTAKTASKAKADESADASEAKADAEKPQRKPRAKKTETTEAE